MQPFGVVATGTYCVKIDKLFLLMPGSVAMAANPAGVGAATAPPPTEMNPMGLRSTLVKKNNLFLMIGPPKVPPKRLLSSRGLLVRPCCTQVSSTALRLRFLKYS